MCSVASLCQSVSVSCSITGGRPSTQRQSYCILLLLICQMRTVHVSPLTKTDRNGRQNRPSPLGRAANLDRQKWLLRCKFNISTLTHWNKVKVKVILGTQETVMDIPLLCWRAGLDCERISASTDPQVQSWHIHCLFIALGFRSTNIKYDIEYQLGFIHRTRCRSTSRCQSTSAGLMMDRTYGCQRR